MLAPAMSKPCVNYYPGGSSWIAVVTDSTQPFDPATDPTWVSVSDASNLLRWIVDEVVISDDLQTMRLRILGEGWPSPEPGSLMGGVSPPDSGSISITLTTGTPIISPLPVDYVDDAGV